jgi:hypothetical protein
MLPYEEFGEKAFEKKMTKIKIVDECGNIWSCILKIGGEWKRMVVAWRIVKFHCDVLGRDDRLYIILDR